MAVLKKNVTAIAASNLAIIMKQALTGKDNETANIIKIMTMLTVFVALGLTIYDVVSQKRAFDIQSFGIGMGALFSLVGAALGISANTETEPGTTTTTTQGVSTILQTGQQVSAQQTTVVKTDTVQNNADPLQPIVQTVVVPAATDVTDTAIVNEQATPADVDTAITGSHFEQDEPAVEPSTVVVQPKASVLKTKFPLFGKKP